MRKTLSIIVLALGLAFVGAPALATTATDDPIVYCDDGGTTPAGCVPIACKATIDRLLGGYSTRVALRDTTIASQQSRIDRQAKIIKRLRHRLALR